MERARREESGKFRKWLKSDARRSLSTPLDAASELLALEFASEVKVKQAGQTKSVPLPEGITVGEGSTAATKALHFGANAKLELANLGSFAQTSRFLWQCGCTSQNEKTISLSSASLIRKIRAEDGHLEVNSRQPSFKLVGDEGKGLRVSAGFTEQFKIGTWNHVLVTYDGSRQPAGLAALSQWKEEYGPDWRPGGATQRRDSNRRTTTVWQRRNPILSRRRDV